MFESNIWIRVENWNLSHDRISLAAVRFDIFTYIQPDYDASNAVILNWIAPQIMYSDIVLEYVAIDFIG